MRSASDEALGLKSDDLEDDVDSLRSPFYKPRTSLRGYPLESPRAPQVKTHHTRVRSLDPDLQIVPIMVVEGAQSAVLLVVDLV